MVTNFLRKLRDIRFVHIIEKNERKKVKKTKDLYKDIKLTQEQIDKIDKLWLENCGKTISKDWHKLYMSYNGKFDENYFPDDAYFADLVLKLNPHKRAQYLDDKILIPELFSDIQEPNIRMVKNYVYNCSGYYYSDTGLINYQKMLEMLFNMGGGIIKPTVGSGGGNDVRMIHVKNGIDTISNTPIEEILKQYDKNYTIQEKIISHPALNKLNPTTVNSVRIWTYICEDKVYVTPPAVRMGRKNSKVADNFGAGGVAVSANNNGTLKKYGYTVDGKRHTEHPDTHIPFEGYKIPNLQPMIDFIVNNHYRIPHIGCIGWDWAIDKDENFVLIEANIIWPAIRISQIVSGEGIFGENTAKMIQQLKK